MNNPTKGDQLPPALVKLSVTEGSWQPAALQQATSLASLRQVACDLVDMDGLQLLSQLLSLTQLESVSLLYMASVAGVLVATGVCLDLQEGTDQANIFEGVCA